MKESLNPESTRRSRTARSPPRTSDKSWTLKKSEDYRRWKASLMAYCRNVDAVDLINGVELKPTGLDEEDLEEERYWIQRESLISHYILNNVSSRIADTLSACESAPEMLDVLKLRFEAQESKKLGKLELKLDEIRWDDKESFDDYYGRLDKARKDVIAAGGSATDAQIARRIVSTLPAP